MNRGFTLMEVLVAMVVLSFGVLSLNAAFMHFNHQRSLERTLVQDFLQDVSAMEYLVSSPPSCRDTVALVKLRRVLLRPLPGRTALTFAEVISPQTTLQKNRNLRRLLPCK